MLYNFYLTQFSISAIIKQKFGRRPYTLNTLVYFKYFLGCIVCISNGSLNLIWFILAHVICIVVCPCLYALVGEIKFIYLFYLFIMRGMQHVSDT